mmetsp:Transcript_21284/g.65426  ORF Transcript_21284/g.65426 Transcript_21284/m.65426 type:complete len:332 (-) Transcript_21284:51-1046(-)
MIVAARRLGVPLLGIAFSVLAAGGTPDGVATASPRRRGDAVGHTTTYLEHFPTTRDAVREEDCGGRPACVRAVRWARQPRLGDDCKHVFFDVGANVGLHGRFLYEPQLFPRNKYHTVFPKVFGPDWRDKEKACVVAFEPNPAHRAWLTRQAAAYTMQGWRYVAVFAAVGAGVDRNATLTFYRQDNGLKNDWGFSIKNTYGGPAAAKYEVPFVDLSTFLHHHVGRSKKSNDQVVLMKCDIEGSEFVVIPQLLKTGASRLIDLMTLEVHKFFCPLDFPAAGALPARHIDKAECERLNAEFKPKLAEKGTGLLFLDDETEGTRDPARHPLPRRR